MSGVELNESAGEVAIEVEREDGSRLCCPTCGKESPGYDTHRWRHLDTCQYKTILVADVPGVKCEEHGIITVSVP